MADSRGTSGSSRAGGVPARGSYAALVPMGEHLGKPELPLDHAVTTVGSRETCRIRLSSRTVSKAHALLIQGEGGQIVAADLASREGILVNGQKFSFGPLRNGDVVQIGRFAFRFRAAPGAEANPPAPISPPAAALGVDDGLDSIDLPRHAFLIGRRENADLPMTADPSVSTAHAVIFPIDGVWHVRDLNSRTGTRLNGKAAHQSPISFGDTLQIGGTTFRFHEAEAAEAPAVEEPVEEPVGTLHFEDLEERVSGAPPEVEAEPIAMEEPAAAEPEPLAAEAEPEIPLAAAEPAPSVEWADATAPLAMQVEPEASEPAGAATADVDADTLIFEDDTTAPPVVEELQVTAADEAAAAEPVDRIPLEEAPSQPAAEAAEIAEASGVEAETAPAVMEDAAPVAEVEPPPVMEEAAPVAEVETPPAIEEPEPIVEAEPPPVMEEAAPAAAEVAEAEVVEPANESEPPPEEPPVKGKRRRPKKPPAPKKPTSRRRGKAAAKEEPSEREPTPQPHAATEEPAAPESVQQDSAETEARWEPAPTPQPHAVSESVGAAAEPVEAEAGAAETAIDPSSLLADAEAAADLVVPVEAAGEPVAVEMVEATEPTPESALGLESDSSAFGLDDAAAAAAPTAAADSLSDTSFGRAVEEFAGDSTGPLSEVASDVALLPQVGEPAAMPKELAELGVDEEFVAIPEPEAGAAAVESESPAQEQAAVGGGSVEGGAAAAEAAPQEPAAGGETIAAEPEAATAAVEPAASAPPSPPPPSVRPGRVEPSAADLMLDESSLGRAPEEGGAEPAGKPSIFGFNFDGGSFIGGAALQLPKASTAPMAPPVIPPAIERAVRQTARGGAAPSGGFNAMAAGGVGPAGTTASQTPPPQLVETVGAEEQSQAPPPPPPPAAEAPVEDLHGAGEVEPGGHITTLEEEMAVPPLARAETPAPPRRQPHSTAFDGLSAPPADAGPVRVAGLVGGVVVSAPAAEARPGRAPSSAEVFSQRAPQISVELFGSLKGNPDEFIIPEVGEPEPPGGPIPRGPEEPPQEPPAGRPRPRGGRPAAMPASRYMRAPMEELPPQPVRHLPVSVLLGLMVLCLAGLWVGIYLLMPMHSRVTGTLSFENFAAQPEPVQREFKSQQLGRLRSADVRTVAKDMLVVEHISPGFLDNEMMLDDALSQQGSAAFVGDGLQVTTTAGEQEEGRAQVTDLLLALSKKDADLNDGMQRAERHLEEARQAEREAEAGRDAINRELVAERSRGEDRPDPTEITSLESAANRAARLLTLARGARLDAEASLTDVRSASTTQPADPAGDPQLVRLHWQLNDINGQIKELSAKGEDTSGAGMLDALGNSGAAAGSGGAADALFVQQLQARADAVQQQITQREAALAADQDMTAAQREVEHQKEVEDLGVRLADAKRAEADASATATAANDQLRQAYNRLDNSRAATLHIEQLIVDRGIADSQVKEKSDEVDTAEKQVATCVTVAGEPQVSSVQLPDQRPLAGAISSGAVLLVFCVLIIRASRAGSEMPPAMEPMDADREHAGSNGQSIGAHHDDRGAGPAEAMEVEETSRS